MSSMGGEAAVHKVENDTLFVLAFCANSVPPAVIYKYCEQTKSSLSHKVTPFLPEINPTDI